MLIPDYRNFKGCSPFLIRSQPVSHSAKGSTWDDHKYIKKIDGTYYYPDSYEGGRHLSDSKEENKEEFDASKAATEFNKFFKSLSDAGQAYFGSREEWANMTLEDFKDLYKDILGRDPTKELSEDAIKNMFENVKKQNTETEIKSEKKDIDALAQDVIKGKYGVGKERKDLLGEDYAEVQKRVNELMKDSSGYKKSQTVSENSYKLKPKRDEDKKQKTINDLTKGPAGSKKVSSVSENSLKRFANAAKKVGKIAVKKKRRR